MLSFYAPKSPVVIVGTHLDKVKKGKKDKVAETEEEFFNQFSKYRVWRHTFIVTDTSSEENPRVLWHISYSQ